MSNTLLGKLLAKRREELCAKVREAFAVFDKENTGFIKCEDVGKALRIIGDNPTDDQLKHVIDVLDVDKNGVVEFSNFFNFSVPTLKGDDPEEDLKEAFKMFDRDEDGFLSAAEFSDALARPGEEVSEEQANFMIKMSDFDGDGKLSYEDFKKRMFLMLLLDN